MTQADREDLKTHLIRAEESACQAAGTAPEGITRQWIAHARQHLAAALEIIERGNHESQS